MTDSATQARGEFDAYPKPSLAVDPVVMTVHDGLLWTALWRRANPPFADRWALPGVFVNLGESFSAAVARALRTKLGIVAATEAHQLIAVNRVDRDPRGWVVAIAYYVLVPYERLAGDLARNPDAELFPVHITVDPALRMATTVVAADGTPMALSFDHGDIIDLVISHVQRLIWSNPLAFDLLPDRFTLRQVQNTFEAILGRPLNKDSFRRRITKSLVLVEATGELEQGVEHRPAELYRVTEPPGLD